MGKNANQIATWTDLNDLGCIISSDKQSSKECVTYGDLESLNTNNIGISKIYSYYDNGNGNGLEDSFKGLTPYNLGIVESFSGNFDLYTITRPAIGKSAIKDISRPSRYILMYRNTNRYSGTLQIKYTLEQGAINVTRTKLLETEWLDVYTWSSGTGTVGTELKSGYIPAISFPNTEIDFTDTDPYFDTFYVVLYYKITGNSNSGIKVKFTAPDDFTGEHYMKLYTKEKCVPYSIIKSNPIKFKRNCYINENVAGQTRANSVKFYYNYKLSNSSTWSSVLVGQVEINDPTDSNGSNSGTCEVTINPSISGTISDSYLSVWCGETGGNQTWKHRTYNNGWTSYSNTKKDTSYTATFEGSFIEGLKSFSGIEFYLT